MRLHACLSSRTFCDKRKFVICCICSCNSHLKTYKTTRMKSKANIWIFLPIIVSYISLPILSIIGGPDFIDGTTNNKVLDTFVTIFLLLMPLGVIVSIFYMPFLFILGKIREALYLLLCIFLFILYIVLCSCAVQLWNLAQGNRIRNAVAYVQHARRP